MSLKNKTSRLVLCSVFASAALLGLSGCAQDRLPPLERVSAASNFGIANYVLAPGDSVHIVVYNEPDMTGDFLVLPEGTLQLPLIGTIKAKGLTADQLSAAILAKLKTGILIEPRVSVNLIALRPVFVTGSVAKPGAYAFVPNMTVDMAVTLAGGYTDRGARRRVVIQHAGERERQFETDPRQPIKLAPGDLVKVPERNF
jgi:protein involved in polysaccharide export with SLBB domain